LYVTQRWMNKLDYWRKQLERARADQDESAAADAQQQVIKWRQRLDALNAMARRFIIQEEDSYLYSVNGARGYNAYTTADLTNYQVNLPANRLEVWARLESDRMQNSVLRDFYTERYVVAEERRMRVENVSRRMLFEQFLSNVYGTHPYGRPVIGPMESIQYLNQGMAMDFYKTYYAPNNAVIAIVGDIQFDETEALIRKYFGPIPARRIPRVARPEVHPPVPHREEVVLEREGTPMLIMGWFKPAMPDPADLHLELLGEILSGGKEARLDQKLVNEQKIAAGVSVYTAYPGQRYTNLFLIQAAPAPGVGMDQLEASINAEIARVVRDGVTQTELDRVRNRMRADFIYELRDISNLADNLSYYELLTGNYETMFTYYRELDAVSIDDIRNAARDYLPEAHLMSARLVPPQNEASEQ
ncbi:MAG: insulinase family protein, partial [Leptospiraceae bacterium]|nr:insulinase family protein [Leptospiraceae bacterium]